MIKIAICDDEPAACRLLTQKVEAHMGELKEPCEIKCFFSAAQLLQAPYSYDLLFLDIQMPEQDGITIAKKIRENQNRSIIIFITALSEHVYDAFEVEALDYICKPIDESRLQKALNRAVAKMKENENRSLFIQTKNWCKAVKLEDIYYCEVMNRKIYLHTKNGVVEYYCKLEKVEKQLDYRFVRCHRSYLVNLDYLKEYSSVGITLENGERVPASRLRHQEFMKAMMLYMKRKGS